jgi:hypothetical protein
MAVADKNNNLIVEERVYRLITESAKESDTEIGGILGGDGHVINRCCIDKGKGVKCKCSYIPDVIYLNRVIADWAKDNIMFMGIYHTHFFNVATLSDGDISYIEKIVNAMPDYIEKVYFPVISLPELIFTVYVARKLPGKISIEKVDSIIQEGRLE